VCFGFGVIIVMAMKSTIFWDVMSCTLIKVYLNYKVLQSRIYHTSGKRSGFCRLINIRIILCFGFEVLTTVTRK
jgi:hypothetical protein